ncbi:MAG TPA: heparinase II/III family protein, partial [Armatimonadota bacterium]|nr:heparinase II/III family protein [Armatimonadota bacterium]
YVGAGWMVADLALCYDWLYGAMDDGQRARLRMGIAELCQAISEQTTTEDWVETSARNWQAMAAGGLGLGALAIQGETSLPAHRWVRDAERFLTYYYNYIIDRDGAPIEGVHYFYYGQYQSLMFALALRRQGGRDLFHTTNLQRVPEFLPYVLMPWGDYFHNLKFGNWGKSVFLHLPLIMRQEHGGLAAWVWDKASGGQMRYPCELLGLLWLPWQGKVVGPAGALPLDRHFRDRGLVVMRSGWDDDAVVATFEAGRYEMAAHDQADRGNVTLLGYRNHWLVDSGYGSTDQPEGSTSTFGHNLVVIDNKGQCLEKPNSRTDAFITHFLSAGDLCLARADLRPAYDWWYDWDYLRVGPCNPVQAATRSVIFARGPHPYLLVADRVRKDDAEHDYTLFLHTHPTNRVTLGDGGATFTQLAHEGRYLTQPSVAGRLGPLSGDFSPIGRAQFDVQIAQPGDYALWGCGRSGQWVSGATDSFFVDLAGQTATFSVGGEPWLKWNQVPFAGGSVHLEPGPQTITVRTREPDAELWYLYLTAEGDRPHLYDMPSGPRSFFISAAAPTRIIEPMTVREGRWDSGAEAGCDLRLLSPAGAALGQDIYLTSTVGVHPRVSVSWRGTQARFVTLSYPRRAGMPELSVAPISAEGGRAWRLSWPDGDDLILVSDGGPVSAEGITTDAQIALVRRPGGAP